MNGHKHELKLRTSGQVTQHYRHLCFAS